MMTRVHSWATRITTALTTMALSLPVAFAQGGAASSTVLGDLPSIAGDGDVDLRTTILRILRDVLNFMALVAVVFVVIAGIRLVVSQGDDTQKETAKKTIIYVIVGLIIILLASAIVGFVISTLED